jgi:Recombinase
MFYNILGAFAQFYREQLAENVRLGMHQAARQGKWVNRPKFGYDLVAGQLVPNADAPTVRRIFDLRAQGLSYTRIEELTGVKYSTARAIAHSRIYLGEVLLNGEWFPGNHEPLISATAFATAHRGAPPWPKAEPPRPRRTSAVMRSGGDDPVWAGETPPVPVPAPGRRLLPALPLGRGTRPRRSPRAASRRRG